MAKNKKNKPFRPKAALSRCKRLHLNLPMRWGNSCPMKTVPMSASSRCKMMTNNG